MLIVHIIVRRMWHVGALHRRSTYLQVYTNSFLATLNMRSYFRGERNDSVQIRTSLVFSPRSGAGNGLNHSSIESESIHTAQAIFTHPNTVPMQDDPESMEDSSSRRAQGRSA
jgi:hypothetical protein